MAFHRLPDGEFASTDGSECARLDRSPGTSSLATRWRETGHRRRCRCFHAPEPWRFCPIFENIADRFGPDRARWMGIRSDARGQTLLGSWQTPGAHYLASTSPRLGRPGSAGTLDRSASISPLHFTGEHRFRRAGRGAVPNESRKIKNGGHLWDARPTQTTKRIPPPRLANGDTNELREFDASSIRNVQYPFKPLGTNRLNEGIDPQPSPRHIFEILLLSPPTDSR